jgi:hypothetical protein
VAEKLYTATDLADWYCLGVTHERERVAGAEAELHASWIRSGARVAADRHAQMMRLFGVCAEDFAERMGRTYVEHRGGPVVWS